MTLTSVQWNLVVSALRHWAHVDERLSDNEAAARSQAIAAAIGQRLAEQGCSVETPQPERHRGARRPRRMRRPGTTTMRPA